MKKIKINEVEYEVLHEEKESIDLEVLQEAITEYYNPFTYIVGDYAYGKVRLKGFFDAEDKRTKKYNNINGLENYIEQNCAYGCKWFELKRINCKEK